MASATSSDRLDSAWRHAPTVHGQAQRLSVRASAVVSSDCMPDGRPPPRQLQPDGTRTFRLDIAMLPNDNSRPLVPRKYAPSTPTRSRRSSIARPLNTPTRSMVLVPYRSVVPGFWAQHSHARMLHNRHERAVVVEEKRQAGSAPQASAIRASATPLRACQAEALDAATPSESAATEQVCWLRRGASRPSDTCCCPSTSWRRRRMRCSCSSGGHRQRQSQRLGELVDRVRIDRARHRAARAAAPVNRDRHEHAASRRFAPRRTPWPPDSFRRAAS